MHRFNWHYAILIFLLPSALAHSATNETVDFPTNADCTKNFLISITTPGKEFKLEPGPETLSRRVWQAFRDTFAETDPTLEPSSKLDLIPHNALVKAVIDPQEAAVSLMMGIRRAKHSVTIGTYIFGKDPYSYALLKEVKDALARGVDVNILIDAEGTPDLFHKNIRSLHDVPRGNIVDDFGNPTTKKAQLRTVLFSPPQAGLKVLPKFLHHLFNLKDMEKDGESFAKIFSRRMHTKIAGIDMDYPEGIAWIGGRNKDGMYYGYEKVGPHTYNDTEIMIRNDPDEFGKGKKTLSDTLAREFRKLEGHRYNEVLYGLMDGDKSADFLKETQKADNASNQMWKSDGDYAKVLKRLEDEKFLDTGFDRTGQRHLTEIENLNRQSAWLNPNISGEKNLASITKNLNHYGKQADKGITIVTPYPNFTSAEKAALIQKLLDDPHYEFTMVTNSLYSGDNLITQYVVDNVLIPGLKKDAKTAALKAGMNEADANAFVNRFKIYALGKLDGDIFGGTEYYGKLHAKYAIFHSQNPEKDVTVVMSYNGDNISRYHNAEVGTAIPGDGNTKRSFEVKTSDLISKSYEWGSPEWAQVRNSKPLLKKRMIEKVVKRLEKYVNPIE